MAPPRHLLLFVDREALAGTLDEQRVAGSRHGHPVVPDLGVLRDREGASNLVLACQRLAGGMDGGPGREDLHLASGLLLHANPPSQEGGPERF